MNYVSGVEEMNLIEQLGGYEKSKRELKLKEEGSMFQCCAAITAKMIRDALLQHRRENNIFEKGDFAIRINGGPYMHKVELGTSTAHCIKIFSHDMAHSYWVHDVNYRHATPQEIAQGYRDE